MATAEVGKRSYYIDKYADEIVPCTPSLEGWAEWLGAGGTQEWPVDVPQDGTLFKTWATLWEEDIVATRGEDGWSFSRDVPAGKLLAVRFSQGLGWDPDSIVDDEAALRELLDEYGDDDGPEYIAVGTHEGPIMLKYHANPPRLTVEGQVQ